MFYKLYYPEAFYPVLLTQYGSNVASFNYDEVIRATSMTKIKELCSVYKKKATQDVEFKFKSRLAWLIWEAKLLGYELKPASIYSLPVEFSINKKNNKEILMPLTSIDGVAAKSAEAIYKTISEQEPTDFEDLLSRKIDGKTVFSKKVLEGIGMFEATEEQIIEFNKKIKGE